MTTLRSAEHPVDAVFLDRWSPRAFLDTPIEKETLLSFLEAARWAPSSSNIQPWRFVYGIRGEAAFEAIAAALIPFNEGWAKAASALVVVASAETVVRPGADAATPNGSHAFDAGAAWAFLALQAQLSGWQTHAMGGFDAEKTAAAVRLPADHQIHAVVAVGKRGDAATLPDALRERETPSQRRPLAESAFDGVFPQTS